MSFLEGLFGKEEKANEEPTVEATPEMPETGEETGEQDETLVIDDAEKKE